MFGTKYIIHFIAVKCGHIVLGFALFRKVNPSVFFSPGKLGPLQLRNRSIRAAAFEGMSQGHAVTPQLTAYHKAVAAGGIGMSTLAYAAISKGGLSFPHQLWLRKEIIPELRRFTDALHAEGAAASIQIGHCGNMANSAVSGQRPIAASGGINWYGPTFPRAMQAHDIKQVVEDFVKAVQIAVEGGFDAVEVHAGHGYLISQFLSPYTNRRRDGYGGSFENRSRFMREVLMAVRSALPVNKALLVKMNSYDGFSGGITKQEGVSTAKLIANEGADAIVVSGGFVSRAPMYVMRGSMPVEVMAHFIKEPFTKFFVRLLGNRLIKPEAFKEGYFMEDAMRIQQAIKIPVVLVGGMNSMQAIDEAMNSGFQFIAMARALIQQPDFVNRLRNEMISKSGCTICNYCVAKMYSGTMSCHLNEENLNPQLQEKIKRMPHV